MTIFATIRALTFLARDVFEAALYLIPAPGLSGYDVDGADVLAEREARVDVTEPWGECDCDCGLGPETESLSPFGPFAAPGPDGVVCAHGCDAWSISSNCKQHAAKPPSADSDRLDQITVLLEDIRNLLQHHAPVASASPPTPADATGLTLANDPRSVHERHMRRLLGEDQGRP